MAQLSSDGSCYICSIWFHFSVFEASQMCLYVAKKVKIFLYIVVNVLLAPGVLWSMNYRA